MEKLIFLDFDGVLFDTAIEAYVVMEKTLKNDLAINEMDFNTKRYKEFIKNRYLVKTAWHYGPINDLLEKGLTDIDFKDKYTTLLEDSQDKYVKFEKKFFETRKFLKENCTQDWLELNKPYEFCRKINNDFLNNNKNIFIVSTKDKASILKLIELNDIKILEENIYGNEFYNEYQGKSGIIKYLMENYKATKAIFIDDIKSHLNDCKDINGLNLVQCNWGYKSHIEKGIGLEEVIEELKKYL